MEPRGKGTSKVGDRYQTTASEDVIVDNSVCVEERVYVVVNCKI
jgi:hypothetical protein